MRLIDADVLYKKVTEEYCDIVAGRYPFNIVAYDMANMVKDAPTVEPVRGEWIGVEFDMFFECSNCGYSTDYRLTNFCPNCGADMRGEKNDGMDQKYD